MATKLLPRDTRIKGALTVDDLATVADVAVSEGSLLHVKTATVARTNTAAKNLFTLPVNAVIHGVRISGTVGSDAGTTATITVGKSGGTGAEYLTAHNVKGAAGVGLYLAPESQIGSVGSSAVTVTATYAETGSAGTTGGAWTVAVLYTTS